MHGHDPTNDTAPDALAVMVSIYRGMTPGRRMALAADSSAAGRAMALAGLRKRYPEDSDALLRRRLAGLELGEELANQVYGPLPEEFESEAQTIATNA